MLAISTSQASAILVFLANLAHPVLATTVTCNSGINGYAFRGVTCLGPTRSRPGHSVRQDYATTLNAEFAGSGTDANIDPKLCPLGTFEYGNAPGGRILQGGSTTQLPNTAGKPNSTKGPHAAKVTIYWDLPGTKLEFFGYIDGYGNYDLCSLEVTGDHASELDCNC